jgi:hypothetical protein
MKTNHITETIKMVGLTRLASLLGVTYQAVRKWEVRGRLPRTEWTGETVYAEKIEQATNGQISKVMLLTLPATPSHTETRVSA